ncbi:hypothetical protein MMPV_003461 [Pyropia vietnamensis]
MARPLQTALVCAASGGDGCRSSGGGSGADRDTSEGGVLLPDALRGVAGLLQSAIEPPVRVARSAQRAVLEALGVGDADVGVLRLGGQADEGGGGDGDSGGGGGGGDDDDDGGGGGNATINGEAPPFSFGAATVLASFAFEAYAEPPVGCAWLVPDGEVAVAGDGGGGGGASDATDDLPPQVHLAYPTPGELASRCPHGALRVTLVGLHRPGRHGGGDDNGHLCYTVRTGGVVVDRPAVGTVFAIPAPPPPGERHREASTSGNRDVAIDTGDATTPEGDGNVDDRAAVAAAADMAVVDVFWGPEEVSAGRPLGWVALPLAAGQADGRVQGVAVNGAPTRLELPLTLYPEQEGGDNSCGDVGTSAAADAAAAAAASAAAAAAADAADAAMKTAIARGGALLGTAPDVAPALWADAADSGVAAWRAKTVAARADAAARRAAVAGSSLVVWVAGGSGDDDSGGDGGGGGAQAGEVPAKKDDAVAAVEGLPMSDAWKALAKEVISAADESDSHLNRRWLRAVAFLSAPSTDTKVWVWGDAMRRVAVVGFRGTESMSWKDIATDAAAWQIPWTPGGDIDLSACPATTATTSEDCTQVHFGFLRAYASVREPLLAELGAITGSFSNQWDIYYTGHSLGGALATLAAADVRAQHPDVGGALVSFGQPKVGNTAFQVAVNSMLPAAFRVVNDADVVARTPTGGYVHVGRTVLVNQDGELWVEPWGAPGRNDDDSAENGREADSARGGKVVAGANGEGKGDGLGGAHWKATGTLFAAEKELWRSFTTGESLQHHLEDSYVSALRRCVKLQREKGVR